MYAKYFRQYSRGEERHRRFRLQIGSDSARPYRAQVRIGLGTPGSADGGGIGPTLDFNVAVLDLPYDNPGMPWRSKGRENLNLTSGWPRYSAIPTPQSRRTCTYCTSRC